MGLWSRMRGEERAVTRPSLPEPMRASPSLSDRPAPSVREALRLPDVRAAVAHYASVFALVPLEVRRQTPEGDVSTSGTAASRLFARPADGLPAAAWRGQLGSTLCLHGEAFIGLWRDLDGYVAELGLIPPATVEVTVAGGERRFRFPGRDGLPREVGTRDVLHVVGPVSLDGLRGSSPIRDAPAAFEVARAVLEHAIRGFNAGTKVQTVVSVTGQGGDEQDVAANLQRDLRARPDGVAVVDAAAVTVASLGASNRDSELIAAGRWASQLVARVMHVPPTAIGETAGDSMTYANAQAELAALAGVYVRPYLLAVQDALSACDELLPGDLVARFALDDAPLDPARGFGGGATLDPRREAPTPT